MNDEQIPKWAPRDGQVNFSREKLKDGPTGPSFQMNAVDMWVALRAAEGFLSAPPAEGSRIPKVRALRDMLIGRASYKALTISRPEADLISFLICHGY